MCTGGRWTPVVPASGVHHRTRRQNPSAIPTVSGDRLTQARRVAGKERTPKRNQHGLAATGRHAGTTEGRRFLVHDVDRDASGCWGGGRRSVDSARHHRHRVRQTATAQEEKRNSSQTEQFSDCQRQL